MHQCDTNMSRVAHVSCSLLSNLSIVFSVTDAAAWYSYGDKFLSNSAVLRGGAFASDSIMPCSVNASLFLDNQATTSYGGAVWVCVLLFCIRDCCRL